MTTYLWCTACVLVVRGKEYMDSMIAVVLCMLCTLSSTAALYVLILLCSIIVYLLMITSTSLLSSCWVLSTGWVALSMLLDTLVLTGMLSLHTNRDAELLITLLLTKSWCSPIILLFLLLYMDSREDVLLLLLLVGYVLMLCIASVVSFFFFFFFFFSITTTLLWIAVALHTSCTWGDVCALPSMHSSVMILSTILLSAHPTSLLYATMLTASLLLVLWCVVFSATTVTSKMHVLSSGEGCSGSRWWTVLHSMLLAGVPLCYYTMLKGELLFSSQHVYHQFFFFFSMLLLTMWLYRLLSLLWSSSPLHTVPGVVRSKDEYALLVSSLYIYI
nr:NADH dehydrogenase subunit 2 [Rhynchopus humris]